MVTDELQSLREHCIGRSRVYRTILKDEETAKELEAIGSELEKLVKRFDTLTRNLAIKKLEPICSDETTDFGR